MSFYVTARLELGAGAVLLHRFASAQLGALEARVADVASLAPFRHMVTPTGRTMSVAMTNCGSLGWVSDRAGYRYLAEDPLTGHRWPALPREFAELARQAAAAAGFEGFVPDACLVNRYTPAARLSLHQDRDERDYAAPIVSVSLGLPARFLFGGLARSDGVVRIPVSEGDVIVLGGAARLRYHGVAPLAAGVHPRLGACRINLTLRQAG